MALPAAISSVDDLPEDLRQALSSEYVEYTGNDAAFKGKLVLTVTKVGGMSLANVDNLESALSIQKQAVADQKKLLDGWKGIEGTITVASEVGNGATFTIVIPVLNCDIPRTDAAVRDAPEKAPAGA